MIRAIRLSLYFAIGLLLGGLFSIVHAETIPASGSHTEPAVVYWGNGMNKTTLYTSAEAYAAAVGGTITVQPSPATSGAWYGSGSLFVASQGTTSPNWSYLGCLAGGNLSGATCTYTGYSCPTGQNWTLSGSTCTRPDCVAPQTRQSDGTCQPPCEDSQIRRDGVCVCDPSVLSAFPSAYGAGMSGTGSTPDGSSCVGGCMRNTGDFCLGGGGSWWCEGGSWTTQKCTGGVTNTPKPENKKPPCAAAEGVMTSSSGKVSCVPEGTPDARKPTKSTTTSRTTAADGTVTETTKTTTTDPATGATNTETTVKTISPSGQETNASMETDSGGSGGMTKGDGDNSGDEPGECAKEPDSPMCKKGTVKEKGEFGDAQNGELDAVKGELRAKFAEVKAAALAMFSSGSSSSGGGGLPCYAPVSVLGHNFSLCFTQYSDKLSPIGGYVIFAATLLAVFIVLRR